MPSILDRIRGVLASEEEPEEEEEVEEVEPNPYEGDIVENSGLDLGAMLERVSSARGVAKASVARGLFRAVEEGKVELVDPHPPSGFAGFLFSFYAFRFWVVLAFIGVVGFSIFWMPQVYPLYYLRMGVGLVFVLYIPGYVLIEALYSKAGELERLERFGLSIGLSLALVPLVGLALNYTPWGIRLEPVFASLIVLTVLLGLLSVYRKYGYWELARSAARSG
jgi:hypothetical protein